MFSRSLCRSLSADGGCTKPRSGERLQPRAKGTFFALRPGSRGRESKPRRGERKLIPDVTFVVHNVILLQERHKLLLKRMFLVVFVLGCNVFGDCRNG